MASEIRVDTSKNASGLCTVTYSNTGAIFSGITTGTFSGTTGSFSGDISIADKIVHTGDTNTAIRFPSADTITAETGGTKRLEITSDGKYYFTGTGGGSGSRGLEIDTESVGAADEGVILNARASGTTGRIKLQTNSATAMTILGNGGNIGIGTDNPDALLHLQSASSPTIHLEDTTQTTKLKLYAQDASTVIGNYSNHALQFVSNSLSRIQLTNDGKIQIGLPGGSSSLPGAVDSVSIRARDEGNLHIRDIGNLVSPPGGSGVGIDVLNNASNTVKDLCVRGATVMLRNASGETVRIDSSGRLGIGDNSPTVAVSIKNTAPKIKFIDSDATGTPETLVDASGGDLILDVDKDDEKGSTLFAVKIDGSEKARIDSTGALGLGVTPKNNAGNYRQLQIGLGAHFYGRTDDTPVYLVSNGYHDGSNWKYTANTTASQITMGTRIVLSTAASGTAGNTITFAERFRIAESGQIGLGGANYGSSGQVLTSQGSGSAAQWASAGGGWTTGTENTNVNSTSSVSQTGLSNPDKIEIVCHRLRNSGANSVHYVQIGTSGGYTGTYNDIARYNSTAGSNVTTRGHDQTHWAAWHRDFDGTSNEASGTITITKVIAGTYLIESSCIMDSASNNTQYHIHNSGRVTFSGTLDRVKIYTSTGTNFTNGMCVFRYM